MKEIPGGNGEHEQLPVSGDLKPNRYNPRVVLGALVGFGIGLIGVGLAFVNPDLSVSRYGALLSFELIRQNPLLILLASTAAGAFLERYRRR